MTQPDPGRANGQAATLPPPAAVYPQPRPPMMPFAPPQPTQRHSLATPFRDGFLVGLGFLVAGLVPIAGLVVLIITLAGIGSASAGIH